MTLDLSKGPRSIVLALRDQLLELRSTTVRRAELEDDLLVANWILAQPDVDKRSLDFASVWKGDQAYRLATHRLGWKIPHG